MKRVFCFFAVCSAIMLHASVAAAQSEVLTVVDDRASAFVSSVKLLTFDGGLSTSGIIYPGPDLELRAINFYRRGEFPIALGEGHAPRWIARETTLARTGSTTERWIDASQCLKLVNVMAEMQRLPALGVGHLPPYPTTPLANPVPHGTPFMLWSRGVVQLDGQEVHVSMTSASGPIEAFARRTFMMLDDCWRDERPPAPAN